MADELAGAVACAEMAGPDGAGLAPPWFGADKVKVLLGSTRVASAARTWSPKAAGDWGVADAPEALTAGALAAASLACAAGANSASASSRVEDNFMAISALG